MIDAIRQFFSEHIEGNEAAEDSKNELRLAAAALMYETAMADYDLGQEEQTLIQKLVSEQFELTQAASQRTSFAGPVSGERCHRPAWVYYVD